MTWDRGTKARMARLTDLIDEHDLDLCVVSDPKHVYYFTGFRTAKLILPTFLFVSPGEEPVLLTGLTDSGSASATFGGRVVSYVNYDVDARMVAYPDFVSSFAREEAFGRRRLRATRVGIEGWHTPQVLLDSFFDRGQLPEFFDLSSQILEMRKVKDSDEIDKIRKSCELSDFAYSVAKPATLPGRTEVEVYSIVHSALVNKVGTYQYFAGDFVSGERAAGMGGPPTSRVLKRGDTFYLDLWTTFEGYWSDSSRTFVVGGKPNTLQMRLFEALLAALEAGEEKIRPGAIASDVYDAVSHSLERSGFGKYFNQHAGHCLGLEGQEPPFLIPACKEPLKEGMVCALEPGLFSKDFGIQIENDYVVGRSRPEKLTKFPYDL